MVATSSPHQRCSHTHRAFFIPAISVVPPQIAGKDCLKEGKLVEKSVNETSTIGLSMQGPFYKEH